MLVVSLMNIKNNTHVDKLPLFFLFFFHALQAALLISFSILSKTT